MIKHGFIRAANGVWLNLNIIDYLLIETENDFEDCFEVVANCNLDTNYIIENDFYF